MESLISAGADVDISNINGKQSLNEIFKSEISIDVIEVMGIRRLKMFAATGWKRVKTKKKYFFLKNPINP